MPSAKRSSVCSALALVVVCACGSAPLAAQPAAILEEVVVTAQKRPEPALRVPLSLQVLGRSEIEDRQVSGVGALAGRIPGLLGLPHPNAESTLGVFLRGVGNPDEQLIQDPSVAIYLDGIYLARNQGLGIELAELNRVEVLKGPQGTLYGRNASGGAINLVTRAPGEGPWRFSQQVTTGNRDLRRLRTRVDVQLADDLALAAAYLNSIEDGFVANAGTGARYFGARDRAAANLDLSWNPAARWHLRVKLDEERHADSPAFIDSVPMYPIRTARPDAGDPTVADLKLNSLVSRGISASVDYTLSEHSTLRLLSSRRRMVDSQYQDFHSGVLRPGPVLVTLAEGWQEQNSHELQWAGSHADGSLEYVLGVFMFREEAQRNSENRIVPARSSRLVFGREVENESRAVFGQLVWRLPLAEGRIRLAAGARRTHDKRLAVLERASANLVTGAVSFSPVPNVGSRSFDDLSPSAGVLFDLGPRTLLYLRHEEGYKSGGFNARASTPKRFEEGFNDEKLGSWELGFKTELPAWRSRVQTALFDTEYDRIQLEVRSNPLDFTVSDVLNAGAASLRGAEVELETMPHDALRIAISYSGLLSSYDEVRDAAGRNVADSYRFVGAPRHALHAGVELELGRYRRGDLRARLDYAWQDRFYSSSTLAGGRYQVAAYGVGNASIHYTRKLGRGEWAMSLWLRNVADKEYYRAHFNGGTGSIVPSAIWGAPRSAGLDLEYRL